MLISSIMLLGLAAMLTTTIRTTQQNEHRMEAIAKAESIMANLTARASILNYTQAQAQAAAYQQLCSPSNNGIQGGCPAGAREGLYKVTEGVANAPTITMTPTTVVPGLIMLNVKLVWNEHGLNKSVSLNSEVFVE